jgi:protein-disulfide isomerase
MDYLEQIMSDKKDGVSKRQARRDEIRKKERQQRVILIGAVVVVALAIVGLIVVPSLQSASTPVGEFVKITPGVYTAAQGTSMGDPNAKAKIEVFEDYTCSACKVYTESIEPRVIQELVDTGQAYYIFYQFPFLDDRSATKDSDQSANAALCAADQGRFWDFKKLLFANQNHVVGEFSDKRLLAFADSLGLDQSKFEACYSGSKFQSQIDEEMAQGQGRGITGTPTVFINGVDIAPGKVPSFEQIQQAVQAANGN